MANLLHFTRFKSPTTAVSSFNVTVPATAAGAKLVCVAGGGAIITAKLGVGGTSFTKRTVSLSSQEIAAQDITDSTGGTTTIQITLNGPENVDGIIYEFAGGTLGNFITGAKQAGSSVGLSPSLQVATGTITTTEPSVLFMMVGNIDTTGTPVRQFWGMDPLGKQYSNEYIANDPSKGKYWSMIGLSDQTGGSGGTYSFVASKLAGGLSQLVIWAYQNLAPGTPTYANPYPNAIAAENSLAGSYYSSWYGATTNANIAGYTDAISYSPGQTVNFKIDSVNTAFNVEIYRHGFYGYLSFGAKLKATIAGTPVTQTAPTTNSYGGKECAWSTNATWTIPADATPGIYFYNMRRTDNTSYVAQSIFVVRSPVPASKNNQLMVATGDFTWQAYNLWGATGDSGIGPVGFTGRSLYGTGGATLDKSGRAFAVSYNRPIGTISDNGESFYWDSEGALVNFLEGNGYDIAYFSSVDIDINPVIPSRFQAAISSGHSEYWTDRLRNAYENARDAGTHLLFFTSNTALWRVRFEAGDTNRRLMICYKDSHDITGYDNTTKYDPIDYTGTWRDVRVVPGGVNNTHYRPESGMTGQWFIGNGPFAERVAVPNKFSSSPFWRNTRIATNASISVRGSSTSTLTTSGLSMSYTQPSGSQNGDLIVMAMVFNGNPGNVADNGLRLVRTAVDGANQTTMLFAGYIINPGAITGNMNWSTSCRASIAITVYAGAVWHDTDASVAVDLANTSAHSTRSITNNAADTWAVCAFADTSTSGTASTTTWTPGSGLTQRATATTAAAGSAPWNSISLMDTNAAVSQGAHQYSATAEFANPHAAACIMYISPGYPLMEYTIGTEWDYVKYEEPSTPANIVMLSEQALPLNMQQADYNGNAYAGNAIQKYGLSLYKASSGALVFNAGTWRYQFGVSRFRLSSANVNGSVDTAIQQSIINILKDMGISYGTLLSTLANNDATALVDPGAAATSAAYGLTLAPTTYQSLFPPSQEPVVTNASDGVDYNLGTVFSSTSGGTINGIRWFFPDYLPNDNVIGVLYTWNSDTAGTELARATFVAPQSGWNQVLFSSPVTITANTRYVASVWTLDRYTRTTNQFSSTGVTNGSLSSPADNASVHNGKRLASAGAAAFPSSTNTGDGYFVDVLYVGGGTIQFEGWGIPL